MATEETWPSMSGAPADGGVAAPLGASVIPMVNKLQDVFAQLGSQSTIKLPQVAVVGSQSSGKSSVLEALVGRDFLPRGNDICTRRPLVLQLVQTKGGSEEEWGEFLHVAGKKFYDFTEIRREIQAETNRTVGENRGVSDKQIRLKIYSPKVLDITLVDLPGLTKVPVGDQPSDIEARIRTMIMSYIKEPTCLILAVTPANSDLANSDALQMAGMADPNGNRTIGVITKLDIMDRGTDARNLLCGKVIPLRLGYVGVVNRSQEDITLDRSVNDALSAEEKFFRSRPVYNGLSDRCGIPQLAKKLNQILVQHIKALLPDLKSDVSKAMFAAAKEHQSYGEIIESKASQGALVLSILSKYCEAFSTMIDGKSEAMSTSQLSGGARIHYIFQSIFVKSLEEVDPCEDLTDDDIRTAIQNATGPRSALFVPEVPFTVLVRKQIARLLDPSLQCARFIYDELIKISHQCMTNELQRFPVLKKRLDDVVWNFLQEGLEPSETMIEHFIEMELDYINTSHPKFIGGTKAVEMAMQQIRSSRIPFALPYSKDVVEFDHAPASEKSLKSRGVLAKQADGTIPDQLQSKSNSEKVAPSGKAGGSSWRISSLFRGNGAHMEAEEISTPYDEFVPSLDQGVSMIHLREAPAILKASENVSEEETVEIAITKLLLKSYYDIVRKNIEDYVPKAIMHFLVNHTKRDLRTVFIRKLYRENLFEELLQEPTEVSVKRKRTRETLRLLQLAHKTLEELPLEAETFERGQCLSGESKGGMPAGSTISGPVDAYAESPRNARSRRSSHSGELKTHRHSGAKSNGDGRPNMPNLYPSLDL